MEDKELDRKIKELYNTLKVKLSDEQKENTHFKSVSNFVYHLVDHPQINPRQNYRLQELGEIRMKKQLLGYLELISTKEFTFKESIGTDSPYRIISKLGTFMMKYYNFSNTGGTLKILNILIFLTIGTLLDVIRFFIMGNPFPILTITFFVLCILRIFIKHRQRRVFGVNY